MFITVSQSRVFLKKYDNFNDTSDDNNNNDGCMNTALFFYKEYKIFFSDDFSLTLLLFFSDVFSLTVY